MALSEFLGQLKKEMKVSGYADQVCSQTWLSKRIYQADFLKLQILRNKKE